MAGGGDGPNVIKDKVYTDDMNHDVEKISSTSLHRDNMNNYTKHERLHNNHGSTTEGCAHNNRKINIVPDNGTPLSISFILLLLHRVTV